MRSAIGILTLAGTVAVAGQPARPPQAATRGFTIETLADGVYAVVRREPAGLATHANNVFIVNDEDVMVVDTSQSLALTREVLAELQKSPSKPVRYVINTHWHDDHYIGDQVYRDAFPGRRHHRARAHAARSAGRGRREPGPDAGGPAAR